MKLTSGFVLGAGAQALNLLGAVASRVLLWRLLGPQSYGGIALSLNIVTVISRMLSLGLVPATQHFGAKMSAARANLAFTAVSLSVIVGLVLTAGTYAMLPILTRTYLSDDAISSMALAWLASAILPILVSAVLSSLLLSWSRFAEYNIVAVVIGVGVPVLLLGANTVATPPLAAVAAHLISWLAACALSWHFVRAALRGGQWSWDLARRLLKYAMQCWPTVIVAVGTARLATLMGVVFVGPLEIGYFILAINVAEALFSMLSPVSQVLFTHVSANEGTSFGIAARALRLAVLIFSIVTLLYLAVGKPVFLFVLGGDALPAWRLSLILLAAGMMHALARIMASIAAGIGRPELNLVALGSEVGILIVAIPALAEQYGIVGLAVCSTAGATVAALIGTAQVCRIMKVTPAVLWIVTRDDVLYLGKRLQDTALALYRRLRSAR